VSRIKGTKSSAALIVAVVALVAALGGGAVAGVTISKLKPKEKSQVKRISKKQAKKLDKKIELLPGPKGDQGPPGQNATENVVVRESAVSSGLRTVSCMDGERVVGGGAATSPPAALSINGPIETSGTPTGWTAQASDNAPTNAFVLCASP
jgi:hypothetical protein